MEELQTIWKEVLKQLAEEVSEVSYNSWIKSIKAEAMNEDKVILKVSSSLNQNMIMTKYFWKALPRESLILRYLLRRKQR